MCAEATEKERVESETLEKRMRNVLEREEMLKKARD
jgi:hypothetical protein